MLAFAFNELKETNEMVWLGWKGQTIRTVLSDFSSCSVRDLMISYKSCLIDALEAMMK